VRLQFLEEALEKLNEAAAPQGLHLAEREGFEPRTSWEAKLLANADLVDG